MYILICWISNENMQYVFDTIYMYLCHFYFLPITVRRRQFHDDGQSGRISIAKGELIKSIYVTLVTLNTRDEDP